MSNSDEIWRDKHGVCHVEGKDKAEVFGLMGYAHGKDRGMQILLMRILGQGRACEILDSSDEMLEIVEKEAWDGKWYTRAFDAEGNPT